MKKIIMSVLIILLCFLAISKVNAQSKFVNAIKTCEEYSNEGSVKYKNEVFNIRITLNKAKGKKCIYKEKIYQQKNYQMLTCEFKQKHQDYIAESMTKFHNEFASQIAKNNIFEAKLTSNAEVFQNFLVDQEICKITYSKQ